MDTWQVPLSPLVPVFSRGLSVVDGVV